MRDYFILKRIGWDKAVPFQKLLNIAAREIISSEQLIFTENIAGLMRVLAEEARRIEERKGKNKEENKRGQLLLPF